MEHMDDRQSTGGQGDDAPPSRSEMAQIRSAIRQDWPIPAEVQVKILRHIVNLIDPEYIPDGKSRPVSPRIQIAAARTLAAFGSLALRQQMLDLQREMRTGAVSGRTLAELVGEAEAMAEALELERKRERGLTADDDRDRSTEADETAGPLP